MRPLDPLPSIKLKLGAVIAAAVGVSAIIISLPLRDGPESVLRVLIGVAVGILVVQVLARGMTSPLRDMAEAAKAMARGDYQRRVQATSRDEVGDLANAFNAMAADLAEVDRERRDLVANVSHELRTPISALQAVLENLVDGVEPPDPQALRTMLRQVERLGRLVTQLLDLSRLEAGTIPLQRRPFEVGPVLEQAADESRLHAPDVPVVVRLEGEGSALRADGDPERVHQVVANLLENAVRFSPPGATVEVRARPAGGAVVVEVCDEGPGIAAEDSARVFERFYRADAARTAGAGGAGLGLSIARWIVDLHGGSIRPESRLPHGCRMVVELPAPAPPSTAPADRAGRPSRANRHPAPGPPGAARAGVTEVP